MTRTREALNLFLSNRTADSPHLLERYTTDLETQIMVDTDGEPGDQPGTYTDGAVVWGNKRWPYHAGTDPQYNDPPIKFSLAEHCTRVGTTWWDYVAKRSVAVGIDIDSVEDHASTTTTNSQSDLDKIVEKLSALEYVAIVRSTGGKGLHIYVFFDPSALPHAANHHEHTIVARKTLELISQDINFPLKDHVDCVGSVFWVWAKSSPADHPGFGLVKDGAYLDASRLAAINLPTPRFRSNAGQQDFQTVELDGEHHRILEAIQQQPFYFNVRTDMNMIHTHTCAIKDAIAGGLEIRGTFSTNSRGDDPGTANCFLIPRSGGTFRVQRFGNAKQESNWAFVDGKNFCTLNDAPAVEELVSSYAAKHKGKGIYEFNAAGVASLAEALGESWAHDVPDDVQVSVVGGTVELTSKQGASGWVREGKQHKLTINPAVKGRSIEDRLLNRADDFMRFVIQDGKPRGWFHKVQDGTWLEHRSFNDIACAASNQFGEFSQKAKELMVSNPWSLVKIPFVSEYPGGRQWNRNAPQLACQPADSGGDHPHFDMILEHIGCDLDVSVMSSDWCRKGNILSGADYLRCWLASLIHFTDQPLPYLFMAGPQNSGKSIFHECCRYLFDGGIASANTALTCAHNGELEGCFLVYVEERDLGDKRLGAYERIKEWVTARTITIHEKYVTPYSTKNYLHFVQMANCTNHLPLEDGDTRIVALEVPALQRVVPKAVMERHLSEEAPGFLRTLLNTVVPPPCDRLRIPALETDTKRLMERKAMSKLMVFAKDCLFPCKGQKVNFREFYEKYTSFCQYGGTQADPEFLVMQEVMLRSDRFQLGSRSGNSYLLNVSFDSKAKAKDKPLIPNAAGRV